MTAPTAQQAQPASQPSAEALRRDALEIFDGPECPQIVRDAIEWFASSLAALSIVPADSGAEPVAWRMVNTSFRKHRFQYFDTKHEAESQSSNFNRSVDDGGLYNLTPLYTSPVARQPLTERQIVACLVEAGCLGTVKMSYDSGPYEITRTSVNADKLARAIERAHGIPASQAGKER